MFVSPAPSTPSDHIPNVCKGSAREFRVQPLAIPSILFHPLTRKEASAHPAGTFGPRPGGRLEGDVERPFYATVKCEVRVITWGLTENKPNELHNLSSIRASARRPVVRAHVEACVASDARSSRLAVATYATENEPGG